MSGTGRDVSEETLIVISWAGHDRSSYWGPRSSGADVQKGTKLVEQDGETARLTLDPSRCNGCGICALICPEIISLDPWGFAHLEDQPITDPDSVRRAAWALWSCPRSALRLADMALAAGPQ